jgi:hypothetical protein
MTVTVKQITTNLLKLVESLGYQAAIDLRPSKDMVTGRYVTELLLRLHTPLDTLICCLSRRTEVSCGFRCGQPTTHVVVDCTDLVLDCNALGICIHTASAAMLW